MSFHTRLASGYHMDLNFPAHLHIQPSVSDSFAPEFGFVSQEKAIKEVGIAGRVWESAYPLCRYLEPTSLFKFEPPFLLDPEPSSRHHVLELGSGTGIVAHHFAHLYSHRMVTIATDLPEVVPILEKHLCTSSAIARPLTWGYMKDVELLQREFHLDPNASPLSLILCSDLVYFPELHAPLLRTLILLTSPPFCTESHVPRVIISYKLRSQTKETPFWAIFGLWFSFEPVLLSSGSSLPTHWHPINETSDDRALLFIARRRNGSAEWKVPDSDVDLMLGVGAFGTETMKQDDRFESLLLLSMEL
ncbi:putative methyltransferase-domain-containing protein [Flagelloscypha sp. PMI_526]|nr:putative methyltransferase-domain-containing protein [Flagelloscypha sp. PMI_526]